MKIALISSTILPVPPLKYGGVERVVADLALGLVKKGHEVTVYSTTGSKSQHPNIKIIETCDPELPMTPENRRNEIRQYIQIFQDQDRYDFINFHIEPIATNVWVEGIEMNFMNFIHKPILSTFHNFFPEMTEFYKTHPDTWKINVSVISKHQGTYIDSLNIKKVIYHGVDIEDYEFTNNPEDYVLFVGRFNQSKGPVEAIKAAKKAGKKLIMAAKIEPNNLEFYEDEIKPLIDGKDVVYVGEVGPEERNKLYKNALATLVPIKWAEPFGLVLIESMSSGTPVIAFNKGSVPEIVKEGESGFIVEDVDEMAEAIKKISEIDREKCRRYVQDKFSMQKMIDGYEDLYKEIINETK